MHTQHIPNVDRKQTDFYKASVSNVFIIESADLCNGGILEEWIKSWWHPKKKKEDKISANYWETD